MVNLQITNGVQRDVLHQNILGFMNYIFSGLNLPKVYTFSDLKGWEYHIFSELGIFLKFVFGIDVSCRREGGRMKISKDKF